MFGSVLRTQNPPRIPLNDSRLTCYVIGGLVVPPLTSNAPDPSAIFSAYTNHHVKLVMRPHTHSRPIGYFDVSQSSLKYSGGPCSSFADVSPFMLASIASLSDVQRRIEDARKAEKIKWTGDVPSNVTIDRWRPNWVVDGMSFLRCSETTSPGVY